MKTRKPPASARILGQWVDAYARQHGQPPARVRNWVSHMVLGGALERAGFEGEGRRFTIKGGVALELRLKHLARATKDLDLTLMSEGADLGRELASALVNPYQGFTFRVRDEPEIMPNGASRLEVSLQYLGKGWGTVQVDVGPREGSTTEVEMVEAISLAPFGLNGPGTLPCLSLPYHIAQKIHAMTLPEQGGRRNERFRDLVDLLLLREWVTDLEVVRRACHEVFETRGTHPWPPLFTPPEHWLDGYARLATELGLAALDLHQAAHEVRGFIHSIDAAAELVFPAQISDDLTATTWYFFVGPDRALHRVPAELGEALFQGRRPRTEIRPEWQSAPGGAALIGVLVMLRNRRATYVLRTAARAVALVEDVEGEQVAFDADVWLRLAEALLRNARAPVRAVHGLAVFLSHARGSLPCTIAPALRVSTREAHRYYSIHALASDDPSPWWDLHGSRPILPEVAGESHVQQNTFP